MQYINKNWIVISATFSYTLLILTIFLLFGKLSQITYPYHAYVPETVLAFVIGLSCSVYEDRIWRRLIVCSLVAFVGYFNAATFKIIMIVMVFVMASIACGFGKTNFNKLGLSVIITIRLLVVLFFTILGFGLPLPHGSGDGVGFTAYKSTFFVIVFLPVISLLVYDGVVLKIMSENRFPFFQKKSDDRIPEGIPLPQTPDGKQDGSGGQSVPKETLQNRLK